MQDNSPTNKEYKIIPSIGIKDTTPSASETTNYPNSPPTIPPTLTNKPLSYTQKLNKLWASILETKDNLWQP